jgi:two-component system nitrogen regulation response regulator NtrX
LSALRLFVPPLRDRVEDIPLLVSRLAQSLCEVAGIPPVRFTSGAVTVLGALPWPGNLSELRSVLSQIVSAAGGDVVGVEDVLRHVRLDGGTPRAVVNGSLSAARARFEKEYIEAVLDRYQWRMAEAAKALGMQRPNLYRKARQLGLSRSRSQ